MSGRLVATPTEAPTPPPGREEIAALLERIAGGDAAALSALYDATSRWVHGIAFHILREMFSAEEVVLDVYLQVWRKAASYSPERGSPAAWLITLARSRAIDRLRASKSERMRQEPYGRGFDRAGESLDPAQPSLDEERKAILEGALGALPPDQRRPIELAYFRGLTHVEIAETLREPLGTIKTRIRLGMCKLRDLLGPLEEGG
jgi:RNA polymerase sigma-70 factor (ECF subfamily)